MATNHSIPLDIVIIPAPPLDVDPLYLAARPDTAPPLDVDPLYLAARPDVVSAEAEPRDVYAEAEPPPPTVATPSEEKRRRLNYFRPLYLAALNGDWEAAKVYFQYSIPDAFTEEISSRGMNALHVASLHGHTKFVEKLVERMPKDALSRRGPGGNTALHYAAMGGHLKMAKALIRKDPQLTQTTDVSEDTPLLCAVISFSEYKLVRYLASVTTNGEPGCPFNGHKAGELMINLTHMGFHDISLSLIQRHPSLALAESFKGETILQVLAYEPSHFLSGTKLQFWQRWIYQFPIAHEDGPALENHTQTNEAKAQAYQRVKEILWRTIKNLVPCINNVREKKIGHERACKLVRLCVKALVNDDAQQPEEYFDNQKILHYAACSGVVEIVTISLHYFPDLIFSDQGMLLLKNAIQWRQEKVFNLTCKTTAFDKILAAMCYHPSISDLAAELPKNPQLFDHSSATFQMQREMQWFKAIEGIQHPRIVRQIRSAEEKTFFDRFKEMRADMRDNAEKWMKATSNSSMLVSTLIATVAFAAVFTVPGGNNEKGTPIFLKDTSFMMFVYSDAVALFSSVTSILMFLSVLTSSYKEEDFLRALPKRMIIGLFSLFFAIASMMVAFGAGLAIMLRQRFRWVWGPIIFLASFPATLFIMLQLPLFIEMVQSTYGSFVRAEKIWKRTRHSDARGPPF